MRRNRSVSVRCLLIFLLISVLCILPSCGRSGSPKNSGGEGSPREFQVYYLDKSGLQLVALPYREGESGFIGATVSDALKEGGNAPSDALHLAAELMDQLGRVPNAADVVPAAGEKADYLGCRLEEGVLYLEFDERYADLKTDRKLLAAAAFTRTLTQIPGVKRVGIYSGGQPLKTEDGIPLGPFSVNDFVTGISNVNSFETAELTLYFAGDTPGKLSGEQRIVVYRLDTPLEQIAVEQLAEGPENAGLLPVLPADTRVLSVSVNENTCYLNLSKEFLGAAPVDDPALTIFSIVNTLTELKSVRRVQISVEGTRNVMYRDAVPLDIPYERQLDLME